jgi:hypothetical protein
MPLITQVMFHDFEKLVVDFIGSIKTPTKRSGARYIIAKIYYLTHEAEPVRYCISQTVAWFLFENVFTRFGCPGILMSDHMTHFLNKMIVSLTK